MILQHVLLQSGSTFLYERTLNQCEIQKLNWFLPIKLDPLNILLNFDPARLNTGLDVYITRFKV